MQTAILNRRFMEERGTLPFPDTTAVISITDFGHSFAELDYEPLYRLKLAFDDVDGDVFEEGLDAAAIREKWETLTEKYHMFSDEQAREIAAFYRKILACGVDTLIVQCEFGQSRSAAVVAAIREFENRDGIEIFADERYYPNKVVFRKTLAALREQAAGKTSE